MEEKIAIVKRKEYDDKQNKLLRMFGKIERDFVAACNEVNYKKYHLAHEYIRRKCYSKRVFTESQEAGLPDWKKKGSGRQAGKRLHLQGRED